MASKGENFAFSETCAWRFHQLQEPEERKAEMSLHQISMTSMMMPVAAGAEFWARKPGKAQLYKREHDDGGNEIKSVARKPGEKCLKWDGLFTRQQAAETAGTSIGPIQDMRPPLVDLKGGLAAYLRAAAGVLKMKAPVHQCLQGLSSSFCMAPESWEKAGVLLK